MKNILSQFLFYCIFKISILIFAKPHIYSPLKKTFVFISLLIQNISDAYFVNFKFHVLCIQKLRNFVELKMKYGLNVLNKAFLFFIKNLLSY